MTQSELIEATQIMLGNAISLFVAFVSLVSAYLVAAYLIGKKLTRTQLVILNFLYLTVALFCAYTQYQILQMYTLLTNRLYELDSQWPDVGETWGAVAAALLWMVIVIVTLKFMQDIRYGKNDID